MEKIESINVCMKLLSNLHILKEILINIYIFYSYEFNRNKKNIFKFFWIKIN